MGDLHQFIVHYPTVDDPNYIQEMGTKLEYRELLLLKDASGTYDDDPFFYNYQALVGRWWAPWTNNRVGLLRWDPGSGKTRGALAFALAWMRHSHHKKAIFISNSDIVLRAIEDEVVKYNNYDIELDKGTYKQGRRGHGKTIRKSRYVKKQGFDRVNISSFMNKVRGRYEELVDESDRRGTSTFDTLEAYIRHEFRDYVIIVDEVHGLRDATKEKKQYNDIIAFLDATREVCPILLMTATPIVNTWRDIFSILGMMHPPHIRREIEESIQGISTYTKSDEDMNLIDELVFKYSRGLVSDRRSTGVVPEKVPLPGPYSYADGKQIGFSIINYTDGEEDEPLHLEENIYPMFMSAYQTEYTSRLEGKEGLKDGDIVSNASSILNDLSSVPDDEDHKAGRSTRASRTVNLTSSNNLYLDLRKAYDFATPFEIDIDGNAVPIVMTDLVEVDTSTRQYRPTNHAIIKLVDGSTESIFDIVWLEPTYDQIRIWNDTLESYYDANAIDRSKRILFDWNNVRFPSLETGLGKYSVKYAMLIWMLKYHPCLQDIPGYIHTLWVEMGTKLIAASLASNGWEQYVGNDTIDRASVDNEGNIIPRFAIIDGNTKPTHITRIIEAFNSPNNRNGSVLRVVLGSRKSGVSISLTNGRFFMELSPDFNKATRIQSEGRVFRADSLAWMRELGMKREVFTADILALPSMDHISDSDDIIEDYMNDIQNGMLCNKAYVSLDADTVRYNINPVTIEARMYQLSEIKYRMGERASDALRRASIETIISFTRDEPTDTSTHALLYGHNRRRDIREDILEGISTQWLYPTDPTDMYTMRTIADMVSTHTLAKTRYGMSRPVQSFSNVVTACRDVQISASSMANLSLVYERNFFLVEEVKTYSESAIRNTVQLVMSAPTTRFEFYRYFSDTNIGDSKAIALEMALVMPTGVMDENQLSMFNERRPLILSLFDNFWSVFGDSRIVHVLWYGTKNNSYLSKLGINHTPTLKTRMISYCPSIDPSLSGCTDARWRYIESIERESIYLSSLSRQIALLEENVRSKASSYGYYVHLSVYDGELRLREIYKDDKRRSKTFIVSLDLIPDVVSSIMDTPIDVLRNRYGSDTNEFKRDFFHRAEDIGILIIR